MIEAEKLPMNLSKDYLEKNVQGVQYKSKPEYGELWNTE